MTAVDGYREIYWAAAALAMWAGRGISNVSHLQFVEAVHMVCDEAELTVPQEVALKSLVSRMVGIRKIGGSNGIGGRHHKGDIAESRKATPRGAGRRKRAAGEVR